MVVVIRQGDARRLFESTRQLRTRSIQIREFVDQVLSDDNDARAQADLSEITDRLEAAEEQVEHAETLARSMISRPLSIDGPPEP